MFMMYVSLLNALFCMCFQH